MTENEKRIVVRVGQEEWEKFDNKRHSQRLSFQELGLTLLRRWHDERATLGEPHEEFVPEIPDSLSPEDAAAVRAFIELLRDGGPNDRQLALLAVNAWTSKKTAIEKKQQVISRATVSAGDKWVTLLSEVLKSEFAPALQENLKAFARAAKYPHEHRQHWRNPDSKNLVEDRARLEDPIEEIERATLAAVKRAERAIQNDSTGEGQTVKNRKKIG